RLAIANSSVDLPQPDSPTIPMNSPASTSRLTWSTAVTVPRSREYVTVRSRTSSMAALAAAARSAARDASAGTLDTRPPPHRPQGGVADLVERVVDQRERRAEQQDQ